MSTVVHAHSHLFAELARLDLLLRRQIVRLRAADPGALDDPYRGLYVPDAQVDSLLRAGPPALRQAQPPVRGRLSLPKPRP